MEKFFNKIWRTLGGTPLGGMVERKVDLPLAWDLSRVFGVRKTPIGGLLLQNPMMLRGAGSGFGRRWLQPSSDAAVNLTGANSANFNVHDYFLVETIGLVWVVAGTVTAMSMDFNIHSQMLGAGAATVSKLDGTNGFITSPSVAGQAIGNVLYKKVGDLNPVRVNPGQSIKALVTTAVTAGTGIPFVVGTPIAEELENLTVAQLSV